MTKERLSELTENYLCFYDSEPINEFHEGILYSDNGEEYNYDEIDFNYFYAYEKEEYTMTSDIRDFIKLVNKCKKELNKFENGKSFFGFMQNEYNLLMTEEVLDELFDFNELEETFNRLEYCKFNRIKG